jgi:hypothetical protein
LAHLKKAPPCTTSAIARPFNPCTRIVEQTAEKAEPLARRSEDAWHPKGHPKACAIESLRVLRRKPVDQNPIFALAHARSMRHRG